MEITRAVTPETENMRARITAYGLAVKYVFECERFDLRFGNDKRFLREMRRHAAEVLDHVMSIADRYVIPNGHVRQCIRMINCGPRIVTLDDLRDDYLLVVGHLKAEEDLISNRETPAAFW